MSKQTSAEYLLELKQRVRNLEAESERAQGALATVMATLKKEFGVDTLPKARVKLRELEKAAKVADVAYNTALGDFEAKYGSQL